MKYSDDINLLIGEHIDANQRYNLDDHIFTQGDFFNGVYYILEGSVTIYKNSYNHPLKLWIGEVNEFIGITSFFDNSEKYQFTAVASESVTKLVKISGNDFSESLDRVPGIKNHIMKVFCKRINVVEMKINNFIRNSPRQRFIDTITFIVNHMNSHNQNQSPNGTVINYSVHDLSEMAGTSINTLERIIEEFEHNKLLHVQGDNIFILDISKFREIAEV